MNFPVKQDQKNRNVQSPASSILCDLRPTWLTLLQQGDNMCVCIYEANCKI